ncbi:MAG TPA: HAD hydrolase-like protein [Candidatus Sulfotelmatobacter sp.]|jgi:phosphoglycolate phosphatase|nr:HAD hydrolase-like protein [Candidatus Sulfotelmatobacter sp.]
MVRLVLFDIDGTLVLTGGAGTKAFALTFAHVFGLKHGSEKMKFAGRTDVSLVREFFKIHGVPESHENFSRFFESYPYLLAHVLAHSTGAACAGVTRFVNELLDLPEPPMLGLLTGNIRLGAEIKLRHFNLWEQFIFGGFADDHEERNHIAVAALGRGRRVLDPNLQPHEVIVIGDTQFDVKCGKFIGAKTLAVATGGAKFEELNKCGADWTVEDLTKISAKQICSR